MRRERASVNKTLLPQIKKLGKGQECPNPGDYRAEIVVIGKRDRLEFTGNDDIELCWLDNLLCHQILLVVEHEVKLHGPD